MPDKKVSETVKAKSSSKKRSSKRLSNNSSRRSNNSSRRSNSSSRRSNSSSRRSKSSKQRSNSSKQRSKTSKQRSKKSTVRKKTNKLLTKIPHYLVLMRMDKPIGILLLLWPTLWALWVASNGQPSGAYLWIFTLGVIVMRAAGCVINDFADRDYDPLVKRTNQRPIAAGFVKPKEALILFGFLNLIALALLLMLPVRVWPWSLLAIALTVVYPFMKRFFDAPQLVLSVAFSVGMLMAYAALDKAFDGALAVMFIMNLVWVVMFDTQYAMSDRDDDLLIGVKSTAILFGKNDKLIIGVLQAIVVALLFVLMSLLSLSSSFLISITLVIALFVYQQWLIRNRDRLQCFDAFINNAWVGAAIWFGLIGAL